MIPLAGLMGGGGLSMSSNATAGDADGGVQDTAFGAFNFGANAGTSGIDQKTILLVVGIAAAGLILWRVLRK